MLYVDMIQAVLVRAKGCPEFEAVDAMRNACIEFCITTRFLTEGTQVIVDGTEVDLSSFDHMVLDVIEARVADKLIRVTYMNDADLDTLDPTEYALTFADPNHGELTPAPTIAAPVVLDMILSYAPGPSSNEVPDLLWLRNSEALKHGALYRLLAEPGKSWSDPKLSGYYSGLFMLAMEKMAADLGRNRQTTGRRMRARPVETPTRRFSVRSLF